VCWRIQSSVKPRAGPGRLARLTRIAAREEDCCSVGETIKVGAGRKNGVSSSRRCMGESSDGSLPGLWPWRLASSDLGYGLPQLAVTYWLSSCESWRGGGVLSSSRALFGSRGACRLGTNGDNASPSAVDAVERAGDLGGDWLDARGRRRPSCAAARGGSGGDGSCEDVFAWTCAAMTRRVSDYMV
jgi:hypothetical protein